MHNESMTPLRSRDGPGSLEVSLPNYMGVCRTHADTRQLSRMLKGLQGVIREQRGAYSGLTDTKSRKEMATSINAT